MTPAVGALLEGYEVGGFHRSLTQREIMLLLIERPRPYRALADVVYSLDLDPPDEPERILHVLVFKIRRKFRAQVLPVANHRHAPLAVDVEALDRVITQRAA